MKTVVLSRHWFRRTARSEESRLQEWLDRLRAHGDMTNSQYYTVLTEHGYPSWMRGVRVEKENRRLGRWKVIATENRGH